MPTTTAMNTRTFYAAFDADSSWAAIAGARRDFYDRRVILQHLRGLLKRKQDAKDVFEGIHGISQVLASATASRSSGATVPFVVYSFRVETQAIAAARYKVKLSPDLPTWTLVVHRVHPAAM